MFTYNDLSCLTSDLPNIAVLSDLTGSVIERLASTLSKCGANIFMFNMTNKIGYKPSMQTSPFQRIIPNDNGKDFVYKSTVAQNLVLKKHPNFIKEYEFYWCGNGLHIPLQGEKTFQSCDLALIYDSAPMLIDAEKFSRVLEGKQSIMRCGATYSFTGFCYHPAGCAKWQTNGCAECPILGLTATGKDMCAEHFARKQAGFAEMGALSVVTPSCWLNREMQRSIIGAGYHYSVIPTNVPLDIFCPMPKALALEHLGIPDDRPIILVGSNGLRKNKGGHLLCEALCQLDGHWSSAPPRILAFGHDAPFLDKIRACGLEVQPLGWIEDFSTLASVYAAADVFVSPSFQDNLPNTVNESLACGTPVICFDQFSSEDVVIDGVTGFLAQHPGLPLSPDGELIQPAPYEPEADRCADLAAKILQFFELPQWRRNLMRHECRQLAEAAFDPVQEAIRYLQLFRNMLGLPYISLH